VLRGGPSALRIGKHVREFERLVAASFGKQRGVMCNSGSSALYLAIELLGLSEGDEIVTSPLTFSTDIAPMVKSRLVPVFVDVTADTYQIDVEKIERNLSPRTKAILAPNLTGNCPDWDAIREVADRHGLRVIEDSCDCLGATQGGKPTGTPYSGTVNDTSTWSGGAPATSYFTPTSMWPSYKTYNTAAAAPADNTCYEVVSGEPPVQYTLTTNTIGSGSVALSPSGGTYNTGTVVQLTANPAVGNTFSGWSGDLSGSTNPASITMDANKTVTATFTQLPPVTLTANTVGNGTVTLNPAGGSYLVGTVVQLSASPDANWSFSGWSGDLSGSANPANITMDANKTVTATFVEGAPTPAGVCESFESGFTLGQPVGRRMV
jgi:CDP-6-deoxy-D-xylo-4-hexulose-3-dehydrase